MKSHLLLILDSDVDVAANITRVLLLTVNLKTFLILQWIINCVFMGMLLKSVVKCVKNSHISSFYGTTLKEGFTL